MSLHSAIATVGGCTAISRVLGFIREILLARYLGAGMMADAFFVALRFPNLFRSLFAEGTLNVAFVPLFSGELHSKGKEQALTFARSVFGFLFYVLLIFTVLMEVLMPCLMFILAPGFETVAGKLELTTHLSRITFPFLLCVSMVSLFSGILNSMGRFWAAAFTPALQNIVMIGFLLFLTPFIHSEHAPAYAVAWGVFVAGFVEFLFLFWQLRKIKMTFGLINPVKALCHMTNGVKTLLRKMLPGVLGSGVYQINLFLDTLLVSFVGAGAISWLNYANHLFQLPIGVIGVAIGTVLLPVLSKHIKAGEMDQANQHLNRGLEVSVALSFSSMFGLILLATPIIGILFEHGAFTATDTQNTSLALKIFAFGLPAYMMTKTLAPFFYARGDTATPVKIAVIGVVLNILMALIFMRFWGFAGIALATSISVWVNALQYFIRLKKRGDFALDYLFKHRLPRILGSAFVMALIIYLTKYVFRFCYPTWQHGGSWISFVFLSILVALGLISFTGTLILSGGIPLIQIKNILKKKQLT
jgi:putative peptidoglycan lipid II flippase